MRIDTTRLDELKDIMGDELGVLVEAYIESASELVVSAEQAFASADFETLRRAAHSLKGASINIGAEDLSDYCRVLEERCHAGQPSPERTQISTITEEFRSVADALKPYSDG